jgi:hypothetical protein
MLQEQTIMKREKDLQRCGDIDMGRRQDALEVPNKAEMIEWRPPWEASLDL